MTVNLLTEHHLAFLSLKGGCTDSSESILVKIPHYWKTHVAAYLMSQVSESTYFSSRNISCVVIGVCSGCRCSRHFSVTADLRICKM